MVPPIYPLNEPRRPAPGHNNIWYEDKQTDQVIVFVHGVLSDSSGCWYKQPIENRPGVYWPDLLSKDARFADHSIYLGGYHTSKKSTQYEVSDCAQELYDALKRHGEGDSKRSVIDRKTIIFVCHSMGGIVVRYMITARPWEFEQKRIGLVLIASPSSGSRWANRLDLLLQYFKHEQGVELKWGNWHLEDLDGRFRIVVNANRIPQLFGAEACEHRFILDAKWLPSLDPVVSRDSAGAYFDRVRMLPDTDHFSCVKPNAKDHPAHEFLVDFQDKFCGSQTNQLRPIAAALPYTISTTGNGPLSESLCQSLHWDIKIDEEGDAYNEMSYKGIALASRRPYIFVLPPAEVQSGHTTEYDLIWDDRTSEGASLKPAKISSVSIEMNVEFANRPTKNNPASFALRSWDWNAYSMNMEEYRQKPGWSEDGRDYAEKYIPQPWESFFMLIQFPSQMVFAKRPFFEIYNPSTDIDPIRNDELTAEYQHCFHYSRALNQAVLSVQLPPSPPRVRGSF